VIEKKRFGGNLKEVHESVKAADVG
jgi:hypothetical protein